MGKNQTHKSMQMAKHSRGGGGGGPEDVDPRYAGAQLCYGFKWQRACCAGSLSLLPACT